MRSRSSKAADKKWAVEYLTDRMLGRTPQTIELSSNDSLNVAEELDSLSVEEQRALAAQYEKDLEVKNDHVWR